MNSMVEYLWLIPALPLTAAAVSAVLKRPHRVLAAALAIGSMLLALALSIAAFASALRHSGQGAAARQVFNFPWFQFGNADAAGTVFLGWVLDPLTAVMLVMVSFVGLLI